MSIKQKLYNKIHLNNFLAIMLCFYLLCTSVLLLLIKYSFHAIARLVMCSKKFSKIKLVKTLLRTQLNLENPKECFNDTAFPAFEISLGSQQMLKLLLRHIHVF